MSGGATERRRGLSVRVKLALSYAGFLIVAGFALLLVGFLALRFVPEGAVYVWGGGWAPNRNDLLEVFLRYATWAMVGLVVFGLVGGWLLAGVMLRPLARITDAAARVRDGEFSQRVALPGAADELTDLADTLDAMLDRVERTIDEERRFAANASHELRTPHSVIRTMVEVAQANPDRDVDVLLQRIGSTNDRAIATTEALLVLARAGRGGTLERVRLDLATLVSDAVDEQMTDAEARGIRVDTSLAPVEVTGNATLLAQVARNLVRNAIVHNVDGGWLRVTVADPGQAELVVENGGEVLDDALVATLSEPFVRAAGRARRVDADGGSGLGLAIVASAVRAHGGTLALAARPEGGLRVRVSLPR